MHFLRTFLSFIFFNYRAVSAACLVKRNFFQEPNKIMRNVIYTSDAEPTRGKVLRRSRNMTERLSTIFLWQEAKPTSPKVSDKWEYPWNIVSKSLGKAPNSKNSSHSALGISYKVVFIFRKNILIWLFVKELSLPHWRRGERPLTFQWRVTPISGSANGRMRRKS